MSKPLVIGTVAAVVGIFALGGFLLWQQAGLKPFSPTPTSEQQTSTPPAAPSPQHETQILYDESLYEGWGSYRDEESGYSLRVPPQWMSKEFIEAHSDDYFKTAFGEPEGILLYIGEDEAYKVYGFGCNVVTVTAIPSKFSVEGTISQIMDNRSELDNAARTEVLVGSKEAVQFDESIFPFDPRDRNSRLDGFKTFVKHNDIVFMFAGLSCETEKEQFKNFYEMILRSVQFFDILQEQEKVGQSAIDTSTWPLYRSQEFGYSLRMSPEFHERWEGMADSFEIYPSAEDLLKPPSDRFVKVDLDINIFVYEDSVLNVPSLPETPPEIPAVPSATAGKKEETRAFFEQLRNAEGGEELFLDGEVILKVNDINLDGRVASQFLLRGTHGTVYAGENYLLSFEFEADKMSDLEEYMPYVDAALTTFRFNNFSP